MTHPEFMSGMRLLEGLPFPPQTYETHWTGLEALPADVFVAACRAATKACSRFPSPYELRQLADLQPRDLPPLLEPVLPLPAPVVIGHLPNGKAIAATAIKPYACEDCSDTGWFTWWCGGEPVKPWRLRRECERTGLHLPHEYAEHCACWSTNPVLVRKRDVAAQYASQRLEEGRRRSA